MFIILPGHLLKSISDLQLKLVQLCNYRLSNLKAHHKSFMISY